MSGGERVQTALLDLYTDYEIYRKAEAEDNEKDDDGDGVKDVNQIVSCPPFPLCRHLTHTPAFRMKCVILAEWKGATQPPHSSGPCYR